MSGHSKWSTIKRKKEATDQARGKEFSKLARAISIAIKTGGGPNPDTNYKLRVAIDAAKAANMPKANIERALSKAGEAANLEEVVYEGFGPDGVNIIVEATTDNRNRTGQEIKGIFEKGGGRMAGPGAVSHNFDSVGVIIVTKNNDPQTQMLSLIDLGVEDVEEGEDSLDLYVAAGDLSNLGDKIKESGFKVTHSDLIMRPKTTITINNQVNAKKILEFIDKLEVQDDVQKVFSNLEINDETLELIAKHV